MLMKMDANPGTNLADQMGIARVIMKDGMMGTTTDTEKATTPVVMNSNNCLTTIYDRISALCAKHNITGGKLCADIGISRGILTDLKAGRKKDLTATTAYKLAKYFGVTVGYLLGYEDK